MENEMYKGLLPRRRTKKKKKDGHEQNTLVIHEMNESKQQCEHHTCYAHDHARKGKFTTAHGVQKPMEIS
jgi:hypothetical protein